MNHDLFRERLALRAYGELSPDEDRALDAHLASCGVCRAFGRELGRTLGGLAALERAAPEPDGDWIERLSAAAAPRRFRLLRAAAPFAAGLAAGLALAAVFFGGDPRGPADPGDAPADVTVHSNVANVANVATEPKRVEFVARPDPPPPTTSRGILAHVRTWRRR